MSDVLIKGAGLLGTSLGLGLSQTGVSVTLEDLNPEAVRTAVAMGAGIDAAMRDAGDRYCRCAARPDRRRGGCRACALPAGHRHRRGQCEVGAHRRPAGRWCRPVALRRWHPMAGREVSGAAAGRGDLFEDRPWILTPIPQTDPVRLARVGELAESLRAVVRLMDPGGARPGRCACVRTRRRWWRRCWPPSCSTPRRPTSAWPVRGCATPLASPPATRSCGGRSCSRTPSTSRPT